VFAKDKDAKTNRKDKIKEYIIGDVTVEIVDGSMIRVNGVETDIRGLEFFCDNLFLFIES